MKLNTFGNNQTEIELGDNLVMFFSYSTPVACYVRNKGYFRTNEKHSNTTTKHINNWLGGTKAEEKPQSWFNDLFNNKYKIDSDTKELLNQIYDTLFENVGMSPNHTKFPLDQVQFCEVDSSYGIYFEINNEAYELKLTKKETV
jgi:hypothetical protein